MATPRTSGDTNGKPKLKAGEFLYYGVVISSGSSTKDRKLVRDMRESLERVTRDRQHARV